MSGQTGQTETHYEVGLRAGAWTAEQLQRIGWESAAACLEQMERNYQEQIAGLARLSPEHAERHAEYMEGVITAQRQSLQALIDEGY